jgi:hypothetical protein
MSSSEEILSSWDGLTFPFAIMRELAERVDELEAELAVSTVSYNERIGELEGEVDRLQQALRDTDPKWAHLDPEYDLDEIVRLQWEEVERAFSALPKIHQRKFLASKIT